MRLTRTIAALAALAICVSLPACNRTEQPSAGPAEKATIACAALTEAALAQIAQAQGYYRQEELEALVSLQPYGKLALNEVLAGKADFATVAEIPCMLAIMNGEKIAIIATIQSSNKQHMIVARKDRGIVGAADLKSKTIAATAGTTAEFYLDTFLITHGISRNMIRAVNLKAEELSSALASGAVDAVSVFNPYALHTRKQLGSRGITFADNDIYTMTFNIVARQEFIRNHPERVAKLLRALIKAENYVRTNPAEAQKIVASFTRLSLDELGPLWANNVYRVSLDQHLVLALEDESRWAIERGLIKNRKIPNYLDFIYFDGLRSIAPEAVKILR